MNKTKIILITLTAVLALAAIILLVVFHTIKTDGPSVTTNTNSPYHSGASSPISDSGFTIPSGTGPNFPSTYRLSVTSSDSSYSGILTANNEQTTLSETDIQQYGLVYFNTTHDLMFIQCPQGYVSSHPTSATGNTVNTDPDIGSNIALNAGTENNLSIICTK